MMDDRKPIRLTGEQAWIMAELLADDFIEPKPGQPGAWWFHWSNADVHRYSVTGLQAMRLVTCHGNRIVASGTARELGRRLYDGTE